LILSSSRGPSSVPSITSSINRKSVSAWMKRITIYASLKNAILSLHPTCGYLLSDALLFCFLFFRFLSLARISSRLASHPAPGKMSNLFISHSTIDRTVVVSYIIRVLFLVNVKL
jgi:hypothetical protein